MTVKTISASLLLIASLTVGGVELEQASQLSDIHTKAGVSASMTIAMMDYSKSHAADVRQALVDEFALDGEVDINNYILHMQVIDDHFKELSEAGELPDWTFAPGDYTNEEKISMIHASLLSK